MVCQWMERDSALGEIRASLVHASLREGRMGDVADDVTVDDLMTGLIATCAMRGLSTLSLRGDRFFEAIEASYRELERLAPDAGLDVRFTVLLDRVYRDSPVVREAVSTAVQRNLISLDNPEYQEMRIKFSRDEAARLLKDLPGDARVYDRIADVYLEDQPVPVV